MNVGLKEVAIFAVGVGVGLYVAKLYARNQVNSTIHDALAPFGLADGKVESILQGIVTPAVVG